MENGRNALDLFKLYLSKMQREYNPHYYFLEDSDYPYEPQPPKIKFARIGDYEVRLTPRIHNTRKLMHFALSGCRRAQQKILHWEGNGDRGETVYDVYLQLNELATMFYLELLQYVILNLDPNEDTVRPLFLIMSQRLTAVNKLVLNTYEEQTDKAAGLPLVRTALEPLLSDYTAEMLEAVCKGMPAYFSLRTLKTDTPESRPYKKKHLATLMSLLPPQEFFKLREIMNYYGEDFLLLFEDELYSHIVTHYLATGTDCYDGCDLAYYKFYLSREALTDLPALQQRFAEQLERLLHEEYAALDGRNFSVKNGQTSAEIFKNPLNLIKNCPYLTEKTKQSLAETADTLFASLKAKRRGPFGLW